VADAATVCADAGSIHHGRESVDIPSDPVTARSLFKSAGGANTLGEHERGLTVRHAKETDMTIEVQCRECGGVLRAKDDAVGSTLPCPKCGSALAVEGTPRRSVGRSGGMLPIALSLLALAVSIFAACWTYFRDPLGRGLSAYDFSTPEAAVRSELEMQLNKDFRAQVDLQSVRSEKRNREFLDTLEIHKTVDYDRSGELRLGNEKEFDPVWKVVFISFRRDGKKQYIHRLYRRHKESGLWMQGFAFNLRGELAKEVSEWNRQGRPGAARKPFQRPGVARPPGAKNRP
jgi:hypothetical protein